MASSILARRSSWPLKLSSRMSIPSRSFYDISTTGSRRLRTTPRILVSKLSHMSSSAAPNSRLLLFPPPGYPDSYDTRFCLFLSYYLAVLLVSLIFEDVFYLFVRCLSRGFESLRLRAPPRGSGLSYLEVYYWLVSSSLKETLGLTKLFMSFGTN